MNSIDLDLAGTALTSVVRQLRLSLLAKLSKKDVKITPPPLKYVNASVFYVIWRGRWTRFVRSLEIVGIKGGMGRRGTLGAVHPSLFGGICIFIKKILHLRKTYFDYE